MLIFLVGGIVREGLRVVVLGRRYVIGGRL